MKPPTAPRRIRSARSGLALALVLPLLAGCTSLFEAKPDPTRFYLLSAPVVVAPAASTATGRGATLGLNRIELPAYLRTPAVILRPGGTEVRSAPDARWAEALDQGLARVLREMLAVQPGVRSVVTYPAPQAVPPKFELTVRVLACEGLVGPAGRQARLAATWELRATAPGAEALPVAAGTFESAPAEWADGDYAALTEKLGAAVAALAREVAAALPQ